MPPAKPPARRARGNVYWLPSGSARVTVYGGIDQQLMGKRIQKEAEKVQTRLLNQVDERRSPRTETTVNELLDVIEVERRTRAGYVAICRLQVGRVRAGTVEGLSLCRDRVAVG